MDMSVAVGGPCGVPYVTDEEQTIVISECEELRKIKQVKKQYRCRSIIAACLSRETPCKAPITTFSF